MKKKKTLHSFFNRSDKDSLERWRHLEFAMKVPKDMEAYEHEQVDLKLKKNEIYFRNWNAGL